MNRAFEVLTRAVFVSLVLACCNPDLLGQPAAPRHVDASSVRGTWKGESTCVNSKRTACKDEVIVYRFEPINGKSDVVLLLADKIIEGERVPMGKLECKYIEAKGELSCEFTIRQTHGLWQYSVSGENLEGTLLLLPDKELVRRVKAKRISENDVPVAPAKEKYDGP